MQESIIKNQEKKRVSILLSCWKADALISGYIEAITSKFIQENCTLIAVDFPFSHQDPDHVRSELHRYPDIIYIEQNQPLSLYEAWNIGAKAAKTEYLANLNLDDRVSEDYYLTGLEELRASGADVFSSASFMTDVIGQWGGNTRLQEHLPKEYLAGHRVVPYGLEQLVYAEGGLPRKRNPPHCAPIWRKSLHKTNGWFDCKRFDFCADFEFWIRVAANGGKFILLNEPKTLFYAAPGTASDRIMHHANGAIIERWEALFPPVNYKESHLGRQHDLIHYSMNLNAIFSSRKYYWGISDLVSIVVIAHAGASLLRECLNSIAQQDYLLLDCIVVLDGADSELRDVATEFSNIDTRFRTVNIEARTERNYARNIGHSLAVGKWVCFVDGDDLLTAKSISSRVSTAKKFPGRIVFGGLEIFNSDRIISKNTGKETYTHENLRLGWPHHCTLLLPNDAASLKGLRYPAKPTDVFSDQAHIAGEDVEFMINLLKSNPQSSMVNSGAPAYRYRRHPSSSYSKRHVSISKVINVLVREFGIPSKSDPDYSSSLSRRIMNYVFWCSVNNENPDSNLPNLHQIVGEVKNSITRENFDKAINEFRAELSSLINIERNDKDVTDSVLERSAVQIGLLPSKLTSNRPNAAHVAGGTGADAPAPAPAAPAPGASDFGKLLRFKDRHRGGECLILCNGPSLKQVDFKKIDRKRFKIIGLNKIHLGFDLLGIQPDYIVAVNKKVIEQSAEEFSRLPIIKFISNRVDLNKFPPNPALYHINTVNLPRPNKRFSEDIVSYINEGWTVTHAALQLVYYMGFSNVYIVGMDHRFSQHIPGLENKESIIKGDDLDHFHPNYFGHGQAWDFPDLKNSEISYSSARKAYTEAGRNIFDCTIGGACDVFEKMSVNGLYSDF